ncbi:DmpA family aminopeptidase [Limibacillus halophilus]|uniref:L-aminopeptidase/D-esterase-like protein n=1 Tax=Limibacillus halophilus TaxID=1579333 RepID=A0A839SPK3_9PROT|nr:P1 family peptidase [Limibacillus halophilus]MBB3064741.1 L-aminopeptidase/D-esterase-like protein [Limibacillus halophilus]
MTKRAREWGLPLPGTPGSFNAITDVPGVAVGYSTLIQGDGPLVIGQGPVRSGVTAILPRGLKAVGTPVFAAYHSLNGNGELSGCHWIAEGGLLEGPIAITNTHSVGAVHEGVLRWGLQQGHKRLTAWGLPVVGETYDGELNDINGFHVRPEHAMAALDAASSGVLPMGSLGGGTGMICYGYKGGSGSASRRVRVCGADYNLGVFVQANFGRRRELVVCGVPIGLELDCSDELRGKPAGSIIGVVATDAPLLPHQLRRLAQRVGLGMARSGSISHNGSGDIFLAFSTANAQAAAVRDGFATATYLANDSLDPLFEAVVEASDEAILDSIFVNEDMTGRDSNFVPALPDSVVQRVLARVAR